MADLVKAELDIPPDAWDPPAADTTRGVIRKFHPPTKRYPEGRLEVYVPVDKTTFYWQTDLLPRAWLVSPASPPPRAQQQPAPDGSDDELASPPRRSTRKTPSKAPAPPSSARVTRSRAAAVQTPGGGGGGGASSGISSNDEDSDFGRTSRRDAAAAAADVPAAAPAFVPSPPGISPSFRLAGGHFDEPADADAADPAPSATAASAAPQHQSTGRFLFNCALLVAVAVPAVLYGVDLRRKCTPTQLAAPLGPWGSPIEAADVLTCTYWCALGAQWPVMAVMAVFTLNVDLLFWVISLIQGSTWLIDPFWTIIPPMIGLFYQFNPWAASQLWRSRVSMSLLWAWSARLTHSYFRREEWDLGAREDWRFGDLKKQSGNHWWWMSMFLVYVPQQLMLVGVTLPLWAVHSSASPPWGVLDTLATVGGIAGLTIAAFADTQLRTFMVANERRQAAGKDPIMLLDTGLWYYSRHPNYFGEQLWWWSLALFGIVAGQPWTVIGTLFNSICLVGVTSMTEARMLRRPERAAVFRSYQRSTSPLVPWFKKTHVA